MIDFTGTLRRGWQQLIAHIDFPLLIITLLIMGFGLATVYSATFDSSNRAFTQAGNMGFAMVIMWFVSRIPPQKLMSFAIPLYVIGLLLLVAVFLFGIKVNGAKRWLSIGVTRIQPAEIMKIAMPLMLAWYFQKYETMLKFKHFVVAGLLLLIPFALIAKQPDLGTALLVGAAGFFVIFFAGLPWKLVLPPVLIGAVVIIGILTFETELCADGVDWVVLHEYQRQRVCTLLDPTRDPLGKGFHILQGMIAIGSGGLWGKGFMQGTQTHLEFIPERTTDFIFAAYSEEFGLVGNLAVIAGFIFLIVRSLMIAADGPTLFARLLAASLATIFFAYAFVNMGMVSGILPVVGVPLPFISYGGTALVTLGLALGMLMSIAKARRLMQS